MSFVVRAMFPNVRRGTGCIPFRFRFRCFGVDFVRKTHTKMSSERFKEADALFAVPKLPKRAGEDQIVKVGGKMLVTTKEVRKVVPEEQYVDNMKTIIERDYFPDLKKLRVQREYLDAIASGNDAKVREMQLKYRIKKLPTATPSLSDFATPSTSYSELEGDNSHFPFCNVEGDNDRLDDEPRKKKPKALDKLSLQSYLNKYTSEDNASFEELAALMNERERKKNAWMYDAERKHNEKLVTQQAAITAADEQLLAIANKEDARPLALDNWTYKARNHVLFNPSDEAPLTKEEYIERLRQNEIEIHKEATRLPAEEVSHAKPVTMARAALHQAANQAGKFDVTGRDMGTVDAETLGVVATPIPDPGVEDTPLMTWGEIDGTPFRLDGEDNPIVLNDAPAFKIPEMPVRDQLLNSINNTIGKRYTDKRKTALNTAAKAHPNTPRFGSKRAQLAMGLSPAAKRLMHNQLGIKVGSFGSMTPSSVTPGSTQSSTRSTSSAFGRSPAIKNLVRTKKPQREYPATPQHEMERAAAAAVSDLLDLQPQVPFERPRAVDFD